MTNPAGRTALIPGYRQIGRAVAQELAGRGWRVRVLRRSGDAAWAPGHAHAGR